METKPILVIGDTCRDIFVHCHCSRLCPEAPVPVLDIMREVQNLGMAGNVYENIKALGYSVELLANNNAHSITKTRYVETKTNHMFIRIDVPVKPERIDLTNVDFNIYSAIVVSDYNKGFLGYEDLKLISNSHPLTFLDTKKTLGDWAKHFTFIKINRSEYAQSLPFISNEVESKIIVTLGEEGCRYQDKFFPVKQVEIKNLSGAGDTFLAALTVKYVLTNDINSSLIFANEAATLVVQKVGVGTCPELALKKL